MLSTSADISALVLLVALLTTITVSLCNFLRQPGFTYSSSSSQTYYLWDKFCSWKELSKNVWHGGIPQGRPQMPNMSHFWAIFSYIPISLPSILPLPSHLSSPTPSHFIPPSCSSRRWTRNLAIADRTRSPSKQYRQRTYCFMRILFFVDLSVRSLVCSLRYIF